jgi:hypothetical protein
VGAVGFLIGGGALAARRGRQGPAGDGVGR